MNRLILLVAAVLIFGCGGENAPMLRMTYKRAAGDGFEASGHYRIDHTGLISESTVGPTGGAVTMRETLTIDKIADDGVTVTVTDFDTDTGESSKQFLVPYEKEITVAVSKNVTVTARLERKK